MLIDVSEVLDGRTEYEQYKWFLENIAISVVGRKNFHARMLSEDIDKWLTISSEAFAVLAYHNVYATAREIGLYMKNNPGTTYGTASQNAQKTKWTSDGKGAKRNQGWHNDGVVKYKEYYKKIKEDRQENGKDFSKRFKEDKNKEHQEKYDKKRKRAAQVEEREAGRTPTADFEDDDWELEPTSTPEEDGEEQQDGLVSNSDDSNNSSSVVGV